MTRSVSWQAAIPHTPTTTAAATSESRYLTCDNKEKQTNLLKNEQEERRTGKDDILEVGGTVIDTTTTSQISRRRLQPLSASCHGTTINSMISMPGVPPVPGVSHVASPVKSNKSLRTYELQVKTPKNDKVEGMLNQQRRKEFSVMRPSKLKEESSILYNIKQREKTSGKLAQREREEKKRIQDEFNIANGLFKSRAVFMAPGTSLVSSSSLSPPPPSDESSSQVEDPDQHQPKVMAAAAAVTPKQTTTAAQGGDVRPTQDSGGGSQQKRILRKVAAARIDYNQEHKIIAETRFAESEFVKECLDWHNHYRAHHLAPPLEFDPILCATAQHWANMLAHEDKFYHQNPSNVGENLCVWPQPFASPTKNQPQVSGRDAAVYWYRTHQYYNFNKAPEVLHAHAAQFTQMIWLESKRFGCGKARSRTGKIIVVANYEPKGNIPFQFHRNVFPPLVDQDQHPENGIDKAEQTNDSRKNTKSFMLHLFRKKKRTNQSADKLTL